MDTKKPKVSNRKGVDFHDVLEKGAKAHNEERLQNLFNEVEVAANELAETPGDISLKEYRKRVKALISEVLSESREVRVIPRVGVYEDPYVVVKIIDEKMDNLAQMVISEEIQRGEMMKIIEEIKGLIVDLYS